MQITKNGEKLSMYKIVLSKEVTKFLEKRNKKELKRILEKFDKLEINPYPSNSELDIKKLKNCEEYRLRIGKYRFIYQIKNNVLIIIMEKADGRGDIYK